MSCARDKNVRITALDNNPGASLYSISHGIFETSINVILLYRQNQMKQEDFVYTIQHLQGRVDNVHIIIGDFNVDFFKTDSDYLRNFLNNYRMIVEKSTHIPGSLINHIYKQKDFYENYHTLFFFSDHDAIMINISVND